MEGVLYISRDKMFIQLEGSHTLGQRLVLESLVLQQLIHVPEVDHQPWLRADVGDEGRGHATRRRAFRSAQLPHKARRLRRHQLLDHKSAVPLGNRVRSRPRTRSPKGVRPGQLQAEAPETEYRAWRANLSPRFFRLSRPRRGRLLRRRGTFLLGARGLGREVKGGR